MKLRDKTEQWYNGRIFTGKKNNYVVTIFYTPSDFTGKKDYWYFLLNRKDINYNYNSLWDNLHYQTKEECVCAAEKKIDELAKI